MLYSATSNMFFFGDPPEIGIRRDSIINARLTNTAGKSCLTITDTSGFTCKLFDKDASDLLEYLTRGIRPTTNS